MMLTHAREIRDQLIKIVNKRVDTHTQDEIKEACEEFVVRQKEYEARLDAETSKAAREIIEDAMNKSRDQYMRYLATIVSSSENFIADVSPGSDDPLKPYK